MKLFKVLNVVANHGVSVFPAEDDPVPQIVDLAISPWGVHVRELETIGLTFDQAAHTVYVLTHYAKFKLNLSWPEVQLFVGRCVRDLGARIPPAPLDYWGLLIIVAVLAAVALGLYVWVVLDKEFDVWFGTHPWAYLMSYEERLWQCEILNVGIWQRGYYEQGVSFGPVILDHDRGASRVGGTDTIYIKLFDIVLQGRKVLFYHVYQITAFSVCFCGLMTNIGAGLYKLREGGDDPYKPRGPWSRPGGRMFMPDYEGCWGPWWWL